MMRRAAPVILLVAAAAIPLLIHGNYSLRLVNLALIFALLSVSLNVVLGYAGQIALGHAALFGIGAYTSSLITAGGSGALFWPAFVASGVTTGLAGLVLGVPTLRLKGHYLALATLGFGEIMRLIFFNWREVTHGMDGISGIPAPAIGSFVLGSETRYFYLCLVVLALTLLFVRRLERSKYGRMLAAIRDAELGAGTVGINVPRIKVMAFGVSAVLAGLAGSLYAHLVSFISPDVFGFDVTAQLLSMVLIGGIGTTWGPVLGAVVLTFVPELLRISKAYYQLIYGAGIAAMIIFLPTGIIGLLEMVRGRRTARAAIQPAAAVPVSHEPPPTPLLPPAAPGTDPILTIASLTCRFGGLVAINDVSFSIPRGAIHALIGPNGSGKSTLINLVTGIYRANGGSISFDGHTLRGMRPWRIADLGLMRTFQNLRVFHSLSVRENVLVACRSERLIGWADMFFSTRRSRTEVRELEAHADEVLRLTGLWELRDRPVSTLPHERQRLVEIARALAHQPALVMLDEPAAGMNPTDAARLTELIYRMRDYGITVLLVEHNMPLVMRIADKITVLNFGRKIAEGSAEEIRNNPEVVKAYLGQRLSRERSRNAAA